VAEWMGRQLGGCGVCGWLGGVAVLCSVSDWVGKPYGALLRGCSVSIGSWLVCCRDPSDTLLPAFLTLLQWGTNGVSLRGQLVPLVRIHFTPQTGKPAAAAAPAQ
jgi:hypothetical protein